MNAGPDRFGLPRELTPIVPLLTNRVHRNYCGGYFLDKLERKASFQDGDRPEDWLSSTVAAINQGMEPLPNEGLSRVQVIFSETRPLEGLFSKASDCHLGSARVRRHGLQLGFCAKLLDSSMQLPHQGHHIAAFAREHPRST